jgi:hypothetical protein
MLAQNEPSSPKRLEGSNVRLRRTRQRTWRGLQTPFRKLRTKRPDLYDVSAPENNAKIRRFVVVVRQGQGKVHVRRASFLYTYGVLLHSSIDVVL